MASTVGSGCHRPWRERQSGTFRRWSQSASSCEGVRGRRFLRRVQAAGVAGAASQARAHRCQGLAQTTFG